MSGISSADAVRRMMNSCEKPEDIACRKLTKRIDKMILEQGQRGETCLQFQIPVFVWAVPAYDSTLVAESVAETYAEKGFVVKITNILEFEISWKDPDLEDSSDERESNGSNEMEAESEAYTDQFQEQTTTRKSKSGSNPDSTSLKRRGKGGKAVEEASEAESESESDHTSESEEESFKNIVLSAAAAKSKSANAGNSARVSQFAGLRRRP